MGITEAGGCLLSQGWAALQPLPNPAKGSVSVLPGSASPPTASCTKHALLGLWTDQGGSNAQAPASTPPPPGEKVPAGPAGGAATVSEAVSGLMVPAFLLQGLAQSTGSGTWRARWWGFTRCLMIFKQKQ